MSMSILVFCSILTAAEIFFILYSLDKHWLKVALGYKVWLDIFFSLGTTVYFALSGTISGVVMAAISGFVFSMSMILMQKIVGYRKRKVVNGVNHWVDYDATLNFVTLKHGVIKAKDWVNVKIKEVKYA